LFEEVCRAPLEMDSVHLGHPEENAAGEWGWDEARANIAAHPRELAAMTPSSLCFQRNAGKLQRE